MIDMISIYNFPRYCITDDFHIYDTLNKTILNEYISNTGHLFVSLVDGNKRTSRFVHRLVYEAYFGEIEYGYDIHHIDKNKTNNSIDNLVKMRHEDHARFHNEPYMDVLTNCAYCGKEFVWTAKSQRYFFSNKRRRNCCLPFCSRTCVGKYGKSRQVYNKSDKYSYIDIVITYGCTKDTLKFYEASNILQSVFGLTKYRANENIKKVLDGKENSIGVLRLDILRMVVLHNLYR